MADRPIRIQLRRTKGWKMPANTVKVDRSSPFGNPFPISTGTSTHMGVATKTWMVGTWNGPAMWLLDNADEALRLSVDAYRAWIMAPAQASIRDLAIAKLRGKNLACWCKIISHSGYVPCHADVLLELANEVPA